MSFLLPGANDAIPYCGDTTERAARFPSPNINQRVQVVRDITRWNGTAWITDVEGASLTWFDVTAPQFGAAGNGTTDDTVAIQSALTAAEANGSGVVYFPPGSYKVTSTLSIGGFTTLIGTGFFGSQILKTTTADLFDVNGNYIHFIDMSLHGNTSVSATYGTTGIGVNFSHASGGYGCTWRGGGMFGMDFMFKYATDAGHAFRCSDAFLQQYTVAPGSEPNSIWVTGDTTAAFRQFSNCIFFSKVKLEGSLDFQMTGCVLRSMDCDFNSQIITMHGCVMANNNNPHTWGGRVMEVIGCRISGNVTLSAGSFGDFVGNSFTFGGLTDNSPNLWQILGNTGISNNLTGSLRVTGGMKAVSSNHSFGTDSDFTDRLMHVTGTTSGATTQYGQIIDARGASDATANAIGQYLKSGTAAASFTTGLVAGSYIASAVKGAASTITRAVGQVFEAQTVGTANAYNEKRDSNGGYWETGFNTELLTLSTSGTTTDTSANLLPAGAVIEAVCCRVTTTITTATDWKVGDPTTAARFSAANATLVAGTTSVGLDHWSGAVTTLAAGPSQAAAAKVRITTTGTPGAGVIRIVVYYRRFVAPTS